MKQCPNCKYRKDSGIVDETGKDWYWVCTVPRPEFVTLYKVRDKDPLLITHARWTDPESPIKPDPELECPTWMPIENNSDI